jgi:hypothetical protein
MNAKGFKFVTAAVLVMGMLAATPASAGNAIIKHTCAARPYTSSVPAAPAKAQAVAGKDAPKFQIGVLATVPLQPAPRRSVFIHR